MSSRPNPYITGNWVSGSSFYGRELLLNEILQGSNNAIWVVGNSRSGKTSLLRQVERLANLSVRWAPLYWDLAGVENGETLSRELQTALEEQAERFALNDIDVGSLSGVDPFVALRAVRQAINDHYRRFLLLLDHGEALLSLADNDQPALLQLHKFILGDEQTRTILTAGKSLSRINTLTKYWPSTSFLHNFSARYLGPLTPPALKGLIHQEKLPRPVNVSDQQVRIIQQASGSHPFLVQYLCQRLFRGEAGTLQPVQKEEEIRIDIFLATYFESHYKQLTSAEQEVFTLVYENAPIQESELLSELSDLPGARWLLESLHQLGYLQHTEDGFQINGSLWRRWLSLRESFQIDQQDGSKSNISIVPFTVDRRQKVAILRAQLQQAQKDLGRLELQRAYFGLTPPLPLLNEIEEIEAKISALEEALAQLTAVALPGPTSTLKQVSME